MNSNAAKSDLGIDQKTIADFGEQWTRYTDNSGYYGSLALFADICEPLLSIEDVGGRIIADIGSGTGRIANMLLDAGAAHVTALEPSESFAVVKANTAERADRIEVIRGDGMAIPQDRNFDLVVSIGVLHHVENPGPIVEAANRALKPGGLIFIWLYGREGNGLLPGCHRAIASYHQANAASRPCRAEPRPGPRCDGLHGSFAVPAASDASIYANRL